MSHRWTIKELDDIDDFGFAEVIVREKGLNISPYTKLGEKINRAAGLLHEASLATRVKDYRNFTELARMKEILNYALNFLAIEYGKQELHGILKTDLSMTDEEIKKAGFCFTFENDG